MKTVVPSYYKEFRCIADKCNHSCCKGWEIDIDDETYKKYAESDLPIAKRIRENILLTSDGAQFITGENKKCPFLSENGLCDIISEVGEDWICNICRDHPRFRNYFSDRIELGLGMCCEEAARLILLSENASLEVLEDETSVHAYTETDEFFKEREWILQCVYSGKNVNEIIAMIKEKYPLVSLGETPSYWYGFLNGLECMDKSRDKYFVLLEGDDSFKIPFEEKDIKTYKNILTYYMYRHLSKVYDGYNFETCISFSLICASCIMHMYLSLPEKRFESLCDIARVFSSEIEYSSENTDEFMTEIDFAIA